MSSQLEIFNFYRDKSKFYANVFNSDLNESLHNYFVHLPEIISDNYNKVFDEFNNLIWQTIDKHAPLKKFSRKQKKKLRKKPWLTKDILKSIRIKRKMFKSHYVNGNAAQKMIYKQFSNKLTKDKANAKKLYYESLKIEDETS